jgi:hypothetical protein
MSVTEETFEVVIVEKLAKLMEDIQNTLRHKTRKFQKYIAG